MTTITRRLAANLRAACRRLFGSNVAIGPALCISTGPDGMRVNASNRDAALTYRQRGNLPREEVRLPRDFLDACEGKRNDAVELEPANDGRVLVGWQDGGVPCRAAFGPVSTNNIFSMPDRPGEMATNPAELLRALADATDTCDPESIRYALSCLQLDGPGGAISATDGRQIIRLGGFTFPWSDAVLLPRCKIFAWKELLGGVGEVQIGRADEWLWLDAAPWSFAFHLNTDGKFPDMKRLVQPTIAPPVRCRFSASDAAFLLQTLPKLPGSAEQNLPVTLDLNGSVAVRARADDQAEPTEVVLQQSTREGEPIRVNMNRQYLARALKLGFNEIGLTEPNAPALCRDERRAYVWAVLSAESAIVPTDNAVRVMSPADGNMPTTASTKPKRRISVVSQPTSQSTPERKAETNGHTKPASQGRKVGKAPQHSTAALIAEAEQLRTALRDVLGKTNALVKSLKQHRRQSRIVQSTLDSLRQLKTIGV